MYMVMSVLLCDFADACICVHDMKNDSRQNSTSLTIFIIEINLCDQDPCQNGATCSNFRTSYNCTCPEGYSGVNCEGNMELIFLTNSRNESEPT